MTMLASIKRHDDRLRRSNYPALSWIIQARNAWYGSREQVHFKLKCRLCKLTQTPLCILEIYNVSYFKYTDPAYTSSIVQSIQYHTTNYFAQCISVFYSGKNMWDSLREKGPRA